MAQRQGTEPGAELAVHSTTGASGPLNVKRLDSAAGLQEGGRSKGSG